MTVHESFKRESVLGTPMDVPLITLAVERRVDVATHSDVYTIGTIGGVVGPIVRTNPRGAGNAVTGAVGQGQQTRFSTTWEGNTLVIDIRYSGRPVDAGAASEHKEVWSLDAQGALLLTVTDRIAGNEPTTTQVIYRRQP